MKAIWILLLLTAPIAVRGQWTWETNNGAITITSYAGSGGDVVVPAEITGLPVTSIGSWAFFDCSSLTSVTIPDSVTTIGANAFRLCTSLTSITIPDSVISIGSWAFVECTSLTNVVLGNRLTSIGSGAFGSCTGLSSVTIPDSVTSIGDSAFYRCSSLTNVVIGNTVTSIGVWAFSYCTSLTNVILGNGLTSIGDSAFESCASLTSIRIPDSVTSIGDDAFTFCTNLTAINVGPQNPAYSSLDGVLFDKNQTALIQYPAGKPGSYTIPNSVTSIRHSAFEYCTSLTTVTIPDSVTSIGDGAFGSCTSLTNVVIGNGLSSIGSGAFGNCTNLTAVYFLGNAPNSGGDTLAGTPATVYYLPGTIGWGQTFDTHPTALWTLPYPVILASPPHFGIHTNQFSFVISWATNLPVVVEASTNLGNPTWLALSTNTLTDGVFHFNDPDWSNYPNRFYRVRSP